MHYRRQSSTFVSATSFSPLRIVDARLPNLEIIMAQTMPWEERIMQTTRVDGVHTATIVLGILAGIVIAPAFAADIIQWKTIGPGGGGNMVNVAVSPVDSSVVLMGGDVGGVLRSGDGGQSWQLKTYAALHPESPNDYGQGRNIGFGFDPTSQANGQIVYSGALKSTDAGQTWHRYVDAGV